MAQHILIIKAHKIANFGAEVHGKSAVNYDNIKNIAKNTSFENLHNSICNISKVDNSLTANQFNNAAAGSKKLASALGKVGVGALAVGGTMWAANKFMNRNKNNNKNY